MDKRFFLLGLFVTMFFFFLHINNSVIASEIIITKYPVASSISYGYPLYSSNLTGGEANVDGSFRWKYSEKVLSAGNHEEIVVFVSDSEEFEFSVGIEVTPKRVYLKFEEEFKKKYDESDKIVAPSYVVKGIIDSSVYVSGNIEAHLSSPLIGENIEVIISGLKLNGKGKENYYLDFGGVTASVHPVYIERLGGSKERVTFSNDYYVPIDSVFVVEEGANCISLKGYDIKKSYNLYVKNNEEIVDVKGKVNVRLLLDDELMKSKKIKLYHYFNDEYTEVDFTYENGYVICELANLGCLIFVEKNVKSIVVWVLVSLLFLLIVGLGVVFWVKNRSKVNKYKGFKRRRSYGDC